MDDAQDLTRKIQSPNRAGRDGLCVVCGKTYTVKPGDRPLCPLDTNELIALPYLDEPLVGHYVYKGLLGIGGMGVVYKALNSFLDKTVAIKTLKGKRYTERELMRFQQEGKLLAKLVHPNLVSVMDFGVNNQHEPFMVLEYLEGESLAALLKAEGALDIDEALDLTLQAAAGLAHAHSYGAVHRDIKPGNLFICQTREGPLVKVFDFGIAKLFFLDDPGARADLTKTGEIFGSPLYMSPEQALGKSLDERSDLYSLGCVLYEMLAGVPPIVGISAMETIFKHLSETPVPLAQVNPSKKYPPQLQQLLDLLLAKEREDRLSSADQLVDLLRGLIARDKNTLANLKDLHLKLKRKQGKDGKDTKESSDGKAMKAGWNSEQQVSHDNVTHHGLQRFAIIGALGLSLIALSVAGFIYLVPRKKAPPPVSAPPPPVLPQTAEPSEFNLLGQLSSPSDSGRLHFMTIELKKGKESFHFPDFQVFKAADFKEVGKNGRHLKRLEFRGASNLTADNILELKDLPASEVAMQWGDMDDAGLAQLVKMSGLRVLKLNFCQDLSDKAYRCLHSASGLTALEVTDCPLDGKYLSDLSPEWLDSFALTGKRYSSKSGRLQVKHANLVTAKLGKCPQLKFIAIQWSDLDDSGLKSLSKLNYLEQLDVSHSGVTDGGIIFLRQIKNLKNLDLSATRVTQAGIEKLLMGSTIANVKVSHSADFNHLSNYLREQLAKGRLTFT